MDPHALAWTVSTSKAVLETPQYSPQIVLISVFQWLFQFFVYCEVWQLIEQAWLNAYVSILVSGKNETNDSWYKPESAWGLILYHNYKCYSCQVPCTP